ncbi:metal-dependent transcriptional regulator [Blautia producta]|uniref:metal-dependent transcriptional regulator n=1 Tax=Blautia producta TaxID=33035 RepID=UPI0031B591E0
MELGKSREDYLKVIFILQRKFDNVHSTNVAEYMGVTKASVSVAVKELKNKNYLFVEEHGCLKLSLKGKKLAEQLFERYIFFIDLFCRIGVSSETAKKDACLIEHDISTESYLKLKNVIKIHLSE